MIVYYNFLTLSPSIEDIHLLQWEYWK